MCYLLPTSSQWPMAPNLYPIPNTQSKSKSKPITTFWFRRLTRSHRRNRSVSVAAVTTLLLLIIKPKPYPYPYPPVISPWYHNWYLIFLLISPPLEVRFASTLAMIAYHLSWEREIEGMDMGIDECRVLPRPRPQNAKWWAVTASRVLWVRIYYIYHQCSGLSAPQTWVGLIIGSPRRNLYSNYKWWFLAPPLHSSFLLSFFLLGTLLSFFH